MAVDGRSRIVRELYVAVAQASSLLQAAVVLGVGLAGFFFGSAGEAGAVMGLADYIAPGLDQGLGRVKLLPVVVALLVEGGGPLTSKVDDEEAGGEGEDGDDADDDADDGG